MWMNTAMCVVLACVFMKYHKKQPERLSLDLLGDTSRVAWALLLGSLVYDTPVLSHTSLCHVINKITIAKWRDYPKQIDLSEWDAKSLRRDRRWWDCNPGYPRDCHLFDSEDPDTSGMISAGLYGLIHHCLCEMWPDIEEDGMMLWQIHHLGVIQG